MPLRPSLFLTLGLCLAASGASAAVALDGLAANSPFVPKAADNAVPLKPLD